MTHIPNEPIDPHRPHTTHDSYEPPRPTTVGTQYIPAPPQPGSVPLRPLVVEDFFRGTFKSVKYAPKVLAIMITVGSFLLVVLALAQMAGVVGLAFGLVVIAVPAIYCYSAVVIAVTRAVAGQKTNLRMAFKLRQRGFWGLVVHAVLLGLLFALSQLFLGLPYLFVLGAVAGGSGLMFLAFMMLVFVLTIGLGLYLVNFFVAPAATVVEDAGPFQAMRRSWTLVRRNYWRIFSTNILLYVLTSLAGAITSGIFRGVISALSEATLADELGPLFASPEVGVAFLSIVALPVSLLPMLFAVMINVLQYIDLRFRHEGLHHVIANEDAAGQKPFIPGTSAYASAMR